MRVNSLRFLRSRDVKRGYLWVDFVELGCRGWEIHESGASTCFAVHCHDECYAHLDRTTLNLLMHGCRPFQVGVINDLHAAGLYKLLHKPLQRISFTHTGTAGSVPTQTSQIVATWYEVSL